mgnify:FL=1
MDEQTEDRSEQLDPNRYRAFFEASTDAMYIGNPDGTIMDVNQAWLDLFGYAREQLSEFNVRDSYVTLEERAAFIEQIVEKGSAHDEVRFRRRDGTTFDCERTGIAVTNPDGTLVAIQGIMRDISARKAAERALEESEAKYRALFEHTLDAIGLVSPGGLLLEANPAYLALFGYSLDDIGTLNVEGQYVNEDDRTRFLEWMSTHDSITDDEVRLRRRDGTMMDCVRNVFVRRDAEGNVVAEQCVIRDVTEQKRAHEEIQASEERFRSLFEQSMDAIYIVDYDGSNMKANRAWMELFGYTSDELKTLNVIDLYANPAHRQLLLRRIEHAETVADEVRFKKKDGTIFDCARTVAARRDKSGAIVAFQGIMRDVTDERRAQNELERLARYDTLTGLLNRRTILARLDEWMRHIQRYKGRFCVVMLDLDHFKQVNDEHGHQVGDRVLTQTAEVLRQGLRETDVAGRYGGEEFLILLPRTNCEGARIVAERIRKMIEKTPMSSGEGQTFTVSISLGIGERTDDDSVDTLVNKADQALYQAKANGRNRVEAL